MSNKKPGLANASFTLLKDYIYHEELTAFTILDSESFYLPEQDE